MSWERNFGALVDTSTPCSFPEPEVLTGKRVKLVPLQKDHAEELFKTIGGDENGKLFDYFFYGPFNTIEGLHRQIVKFVNGKDPQVYTIQDLKSGKLLGYASFLRIDVSNRVIEIGHVMYSLLLQRTVAATEVQYLMMRKAFDDGYRRLEWKCDANNLASRRAALRLGYTFEGIFRKHMIVKGRNRDTAWFSITDDEWLGRKAALEAWMDDANFDDHGVQKKDVVTLRQELDAGNPL
jgi:RimJ/RimL family protein N-acetyltransferase